MTQSPIGDFSATPPSGGGFTSQASGAAGPPWYTLPIFMGFHPESVAGGRAMHSGTVEDVTSRTIRSPRYVAPMSLLEKFDSFTRDEYLKLRNKLIAAGIVSENASAAEVRGAWEDLLQNVQDKQATQGMGMSPFEYVNNLIRLNGLDPGKIGSAADYSLSNTPSKQTSTTTSVYDMDPASAQALLTDTLAGQLGRAPTEAEIEDFVDAVKTRANNNPNVSVSHMSTDAEGNTTNRVEQRPGFGADDAALLAQNKAKQAPDYAKYQAVSTYFPALVNALGATVG